MFRKNCELCEKEFLAKRSIDIYCSANCRTTGTAAKARKRTSEWSAANPERAKESDRRWREANPEKARKGVIAWVKAHLEKSREYKAKYRETHREQIKASKAAWSKSDPERAARYQHQRRAKKANSNGSYTLAEWHDLKAFYNYQCLCCGKREPAVKLTVDHIVPLQLGGSNHITNIQPLCDICNKSKGIKIIDYRPR